MFCDIIHPAPHGVSSGLLAGGKAGQVAGLVLTRAVSDVDGQTRDVRGVSEAAVTEVLREEHGLSSQGQGLVWTLTPRGARGRRGLGGGAGSRRLP